MKKIIVLLFIVFVLLGCSVKTTLIGGEKDEYGCLISAGYTWCELKKKCIRLWEENCVHHNSLFRINEQQ